MEIESLPGNTKQNKNKGAKKKHTQNTQKRSDIRGRARSSRGPHYKKTQSKHKHTKRETPPLGPRVKAYPRKTNKQKQTNINWTNRVTSRRARSSPNKRRRKPKKKGKNATTNKHVTIIRSRTRRGGPTSDHPFTPSHTAPLGGGKPGDGPARLALCLCLYVLRSLVTTPDVRRARTCISLTNRTPQPTFGKCLRCRVLVQVQWDATHCSSKLPPGP